MYIRILLSNESEPQEMVLRGALHLHSCCSARLKQLTTDKQRARHSACSSEPQTQWFVPAMPAQIPNTH